jgi:hypothetical protein
MKSTIGSSSHQEDRHLFSDELSAAANVAPDAESAPPEDSDGVSEIDSAIAVMVRQGILKAREKLIDLSLRNGMLNYRHSDTSTRHVRIVATKPNLLVNGLASGHSLYVIALPPVDEIPRDEETEDFRAALKEAKGVDPEWLAAEDSKRAAGSRRRYRDRATERQLRNRVRVSLQMPEWHGGKDPKARALELGINPSFDLPASDSGEQDGRPDTDLQTLFFPERLEPKLTAIYTTARALQEDAGISALYCAVGFLEWYEPDDSQNPVYAPLVLLPINMEKRAVNGEYIFAISGRDEDETTNLALREKLKRHHSLDLPEYDAEGGLEAYLASVVELIANKRRWRVRRWATIGLFSFSRQAMWSDLDPLRWPAEARPETHELLQQIYGDAPAGDTTVAPVYDVDLPDIEAKAPALVTDADSSQLSAVIDAANGTNLVVQGPPGTGKSQTITNIIAGAMWQGKSILFVSEKMAALKVVKDRLDHMGLGLYCLEIHSAKTSKSFVLKSLKERMHSPPPRSNAADVERAREALRAARLRLTEYAALMNCVAGRTGLTTHEVLWGDFCRGDRPQTVPADALDFRFPDPLEIDRFKLGELTAAGKALDQQSAAMGSMAEPARQPWRGVGNLNLSRFDRAKAIEATANWASALREVERLARDLELTCGWDQLGSIADIQLAVGLAENIPLHKGGIDESVLALAADDESRRRLTAWADRALEAHELETEVRAVCVPVELDTVSVPQLISLAETLGVLNLAAEKLPTAREEATGTAREMVGRVELLGRVFEIAKCDANTIPDIKAEIVAAGFLRLAKELTREKARYRADTLVEDGVIDALSAALQVVQEAGAAIAEAQFDEEATPAFAESIHEVRELRNAAATFVNTGFFGRLVGKDWRRARDVWRRTFPSVRKIRRDAAARRLRAAAKWKESLAALEANSIAKAAIGRHWNGLVTPLAALIDTARWMLAVREATPASVTGASDLRRLLYEGSFDELTPVLELAREAAEMNLSESVQECSSSRSSLCAEAAEASKRAVALAELEAQVEKVGLRDGHAVHALRRADAAWREAKECRRKMDLEDMAKNVAMGIPVASETDKAASIKTAVKHAAAIIDSGVPAVVSKWLLAEQFAERTSLLRSSVSALTSAISAERQARGISSELLMLRALDWCGGSFDALPLPHLLGKAERAAQMPEDLEKQVALLGVEEEVGTLGMAELIAAWSKKGLRYEGVAWAIETAFFRSAAQNLMQEHPVLARHTGKTHEQVRERFRQMDKEVLELNRQLVAAKLYERYVPSGRRAASTKDYTDNQMLVHQTGLQKPRIALRRLFSNAGAAVRAYKPCVMMSPMSVAQYLEPGKHLFDLLVIDEASQMRPEDALGAMLRCSQAVIVGDPEQLPPSDFFVASDGEGEQDAEDAPEESILELGRRCWHPMRMLDVHYRSRHQSLIAYSNREFYEERLLVYPSPVLEDPEFGVSCQRVDGAYEAGQGRNPSEAMAVVAEAAKLMRERIDRSIGIVAVNQPQRDLIERLMDEISVSDPNVQAYRQAWSGKLEDFFVKNLENVQGDERDIILISTVYGRTAEGVFHQNFGPINRAYGHRRLNVLFTRAKRRLRIFTSLDHSQIVADGKQRGVGVLKEFLEYATSGTIQPGRRTGEEPESDFERWFLQRLKSAGYVAHPQVGVAKYRIDIGIVHPDKPGNYILGVECDGATYHSSKSARDRDRLREDVLIGLNWKIHRVWSTDWYRDPEREFGRLVQQIERFRGIA